MLAGAVSLQFRKACEMKPLYRTLSFTAPFQTRKKYATLLPRRQSDGQFPLPALEGYLTASRGTSRSPMSPAVPGAPVPRWRNRSLPCWGLGSASWSGLSIQPRWSGSQANERSQYCVRFRRLPINRFYCSYSRIGRLSAFRYSEQFVVSSSIVSPRGQTGAEL